MFPYFGWQRWERSIEVRPELQCSWASQIWGIGLQQDCWRWSWPSCCPKPTKPPPMQWLPRAVLFEGAWQAELPCSWAADQVQICVLNLKAWNPPHAVAHLHCEPLPGYLSLLCQPVVVNTVGEFAVVTQDENTTCRILRVMKGALNNLWLQWTSAL